MINILVLIAGCVLAATLSWFGASYLFRRLAEVRLARLCRTRRAIVLSYDDGPGDELTPQLLDLLARHRVSATFFVLGRHAEAHPELVARALAEGHELGSHTFAHSNAWKSRPSTARRDRDRGTALVNRIGGQGRLFRPPYGKLTLAGWIEARTAGLRLAWWTLDSRDSWQRRPIESILRELDAAQGGIVLMHDGDSYERSGPGHVDYVVELTERLIAHAAGRGYRFMRLGELLDLEARAHG